MSSNRTFDIFYSGGYACLRVYPHQAAVYPEEIIGRLKILGITNVLREKILKAIDEKSGETVRLVRWRDGEKLGPTVEIDISEDGMKAFIRVQPEKQGGEPLTAGFILKKLAEEGIVHGIKKSAAETLIDRALWSEKVCAAAGTAAVDARPPEAEYFFETRRGKPFLNLDNDRIDLKELNFIQNKKEGDLLARLKKAVKPVDGTDIFGRTIPALTETTPPVFSAGDGAEVRENGIYAVRDGNAKLENGIVSIEPLVSVDNVDYSNGNMDFNGSIDIAGRIADGFRIKANGDVQIGKSVSRVDISAGGDIILKAGISGNDGGRIICGGDLYARYIENAEIICGGNIFVEEAIMHSDVRAGGSIILKGRRAEIFGGSAAAAAGIRCRKLGSVNEPPTRLFLGLDLDTFSRLEALQQSVKSNTASINDLDTKIHQLKTAQRRGGGSSSATEKIDAALRQLKGDAAAIRAQLSETVGLLHELRQNLNIIKDAELYADEKIFGKVRVYFGESKWDSPDRGTGRTTLKFKKDRIIEK